MRLSVCLDVDGLVEKVCSADASDGSQKTDQMWFSCAGRKAKGRSVSCIFWSNTCLANVFLGPVFVSSKNRTRQRCIACSYGMQLHAVLLLYGFATGQV